MPEPCRLFLPARIQVVLAGLCRELCAPTPAGQHKKGLWAAGLRAQLPPRANCSCKAGEAPNSESVDLGCFKRVAVSGSRSGCSGMLIVKAKDQRERCILWAQMQLAPTKNVHVSAFLSTQ